MEIKPAAANESLGFGEILAICHADLATIRNIEHPSNGERQFSAISFDKNSRRGLRIQRLSHNALLWCK